MTFQQNILIAGMGTTGQSIATYLDSKAVSYTCCDDADSFVSCREVDLSKQDYVFKSPGLRPEWFSDIESHKVINDVELLLRLTNRPVFLITGTNGKSTVVALLETLLCENDINAIACGNNGVPVLDAYAKQPDICIVELSSYQLENLSSHRCDSAVVLNIGIDHVDRYDDMAAYQSTKERIYQYSHNHVRPVNEEDELDYSDGQAGYKIGDVSYCLRDGAIYRNDERYVGVDGITLIGRHNHLNVCAALAMLDSFSLEKLAVESTLKTFSGLEHRMELVCNDKHGRRWINDSKSTNVHSTNAALNSLEQPVVLIMGGRGKGEDYSQMLSDRSDVISTLILYGEDAKLIASQAGASQNHRIVKTVSEAVGLAAQGEGDVLFSPACASFDQYKNFIARGDDFRDVVKQVIEC